VCKCVCSVNVYEFVNAVRVYMRVCCVRMKVYQVKYQRPGLGGGAPEMKYS